MSATYYEGQININGVNVDNALCYISNSDSTKPPFDTVTASGKTYVYKQWVGVNNPVVAAANENSPLWIRYNGVTKGVWAQAYSAADNTYRDALVFADGAKIQVKRNPSDDIRALTLKFIDKDNNVLAESTWTVVGDKTPYACLTVLQVGDDTFVFEENYIYIDYSTRYEFNLMPYGGVATLDIANGSLIPAYNWTAWDQLRGNNGQYRCDLTKIKSTALENIAPQVGQTSAIFDRLAPRSSIWSVIQNAALNTEYKIMWSGRNWATVTMTESGTGGNYKLTFKFYNPNMSSTTPFYAYEVYIVYSPSGSGVNTDSNLLLSFAYDSTQQAAVFLPVVYRAGGIAEGYSWGVSSGNMPDSDQLLYLYLWLMESGAGTPEYPYDTGTTDDGGNPAGPQPGDHMPRPGVPTLSAMSSKMFTVYCPTDEQLEDIAEYLWSDNVITNIRKYFNNFSDNIIALYVLPHQPANLPTKNFTVGNLQSDTITDIKYVTSRFVNVDMGSVTVKTTYDSYLDFSPFTRFEIYLPGVGMQTLSADDIMCPTDPDTGTLKPVEESTISVKYTLDLMTGLLVAFVFVNGEMLYQFPGKIGYSIPITGENYTRMVTGAISAMAGLVGAAATGGLTAPLAAGGVAAAVSGTVNAMKPDVHRSGNLSGDVSMMSDESPYLIYHRPNKPLLENQERYTGFPSYKSGALSEFSGLTQVIDAHIEGISCTEAERAEILNLLKSGVIL